MGTRTLFYQKDPRGDAATRAGLKILPSRQIQLESTFLAYLLRPMHQYNQEMVDRRW